MTVRLASKSERQNMKALYTPAGIIWATLVLSFGNASAATRVTLTTLHQFSGPDGSNPEGGLTLGGDSNFYGVAATGGPGGDGTVFQITPQGTLTTLYGFGENVGADPVAPPVQGIDGSFYGTTQAGGVSNQGIVYQTTSAGTLTNLYSFSGPDGANPCSLLFEGSDSNFYGTTRNGGGGSCPQGCGTVFMLTPAGSLTTLYNFSGPDGQTANPGLLLGSDGNFYGTTYAGGSPKTVHNGVSCDGLGDCVRNPPGTVYRITPSGSLTTLYAFSGPDGANPANGLIQGNDGALYGVTLFGGERDKGTVYTVSTSGVFSLLYSFTGGDDGAYPKSLLFQGTDGSFYGTAINGGQLVNCDRGCGTVFRITSDGTLTTLDAFTGDPGPANPVGLVEVGDGNFFGTSYTGGSNNLGTVFQLGVCDFSLDPTNAAFAAPGGSNIVSVTASNGCAWTAASNDPFITIMSGTNSAGTGAVNYSVATNTSSLGRIGSMTIFGAIFPVVQSGTSGDYGCPCALSATGITLSAKGGSEHVTVRFKGQDCAWTAVSNDPFISITAGSSGSGNGTVQYTVSGNTNTIPLSGTMTIAGQTFTINQDAGGCTYSLSPPGGNIKAAGGSATVKVKPRFSDCEWTAVSNDPFITISSGSSGTGDGAVTYSVPANTNTTSVTGSITIAGQTYTVTQAGQKPN